MRRTSPARRKALLAQAQALALERATTFRLARRVMSGASKGALMTGHRLYTPKSARARNKLIAEGAKPVLTSSEWRAIYEEVGL